MKKIFSLLLLFFAVMMFTTACKNKSSNTASNDLLTEARNMQKDVNDNTTTTSGTTTTKETTTTNPQTTDTKVTINGRNVAAVTYEYSGQSGTFSQSTNKQWIESTIEGNKFSFTETGRDEWSVYLNDAGRNIKVQLNLHTKKVNVNGKPNYKITDTAL